MAPIKNSMTKATAAVIIPAISPMFLAVDLTHWPIVAITISPASAVAAEGLLPGTRLSRASSVSPPSFYAFHYKRTEDFEPTRDRDDGGCERDQHGGPVAGPCIASLKVFRLVPLHRHHLFRDERSMIRLEGSMMILKMHRQGVPISAVARREQNPRPALRGFPNRTPDLLRRGWARFVAV